MLHENFCQLSPFFLLASKYRYRLHFLDHKTSSGQLVMTTTLFNSGMRPLRVPSLPLSLLPAESKMAAAPSVWVPEWSQCPKNLQWTYGMNIIKLLYFYTTEILGLFVTAAEPQQCWLMHQLCDLRLLSFSKLPFLHFQYYGDVKMMFLT